MVDVESVFKMTNHLKQMIIIMSPCVGENGTRTLPEHMCITQMYHKATILIIIKWITDW